MKITYEQATRIPYEKPTGDQVRVLRQILRGSDGVMSQTEFGAMLHVTARQVMRWEQNGMSATEWLLVRITFDPVLREQWNEDAAAYVRKLKAANRR